MLYRPDATNSELIKISRDPVRAAAFRVHLEVVLGGRAIASSPRSQQFLRHVVEKSIAGEFESLKERVIAVELFHRSPTYDKGEDAIVRVVASDVRKRLALHYKLTDMQSDFRIELPPGSYVPEITYLGALNSANEVVDRSEQKNKLEEVPSTMATNAERPLTEGTRHSISGGLVALFFSAIILAFLAGYLFHRFTAPRAIVHNTFYPWNVINKSDITLQIIASDPDLAAEQDITGNAVTLSDYANRNYFPNSSSLSPDLRSFIRNYFQGGKAATVDIPIIVDAVAMARATAQKVTILTARSIRLADFHSDDNFLLLGGPLANPWLEIFEDNLDFRFVFPDRSGTVGIENARPTGKESKLYLQTGETEYSIIALLDNPGQQGHILVVAGTGAVSTGVAGSFVMNDSDMREALDHCDGGKNPPQFEILLRSSIMAASSLKTEVLSCHRLPSA